MSNHIGLLFTCPRCGWWISASHISPEPLTKPQLEEVLFDLRCDPQDCGWTGRLAGRFGEPVLTFEGT
jgi:hypothetical protein